MKSGKREKKISQEDCSKVEIEWRYFHIDSNDKLYTFFAFPRSSHVKLWTLFWDCLGLGDSWFEQIHASLLGLYKFFKRGITPREETQSCGITHL